MDLPTLLGQDLDPNRVYRVEYNYGKQPEFTNLAKKLGIMDDWKVCGRAKSVCAQRDHGSERGGRIRGGRKRGCTLFLQV